MKRFALLMLAGAALLAGTLSAQELLRSSNGGTSEHVSGVVVLAIPGRPFSAKTSTDWTRILEDGSIVTTHLDATLARDSQGRIYRENRSFVSAHSGQKSPLLEVHIYDPVTSTQTFCSTRALSCVVTDYRPRTFFDTQPAGPYDEGMRSLARKSLGPATIEGIQVIGTLETKTINAGVLGNEKPLVSTRESWFSAALQTNLAVTRIDPRDGKQEIRLSEISQSEPEAYLFQPPIGYSVRDLRTSARRER